jgi:thioesterase domain-containing protein
MPALDALRRVLAAELPVTQHLGIGVESEDANGLVLSLPLAPNRNHQGGIFAGSLNAVATLTGWALLWLVLRRAASEAAVVIQDSTIEYLRPVAEDCRTRCAWPEPGKLNRFLDTLARHRRARLSLTVEVLAAGGPVARFAGRYVAFRPRDSSV